MRIRRWIGWGLLAVIVLGIAGTGYGFWRAGYRAYIIHTGSMSPTLVPGDLIIDRPPSDGYHPGDIITFRHSAGPDLVTHRMVDFTNGSIHTKGDANRTADVWDIPPSYVEGVVDFRLPGFGYAVVFLRQPTGFASIVVALVGLILLWRLFFPEEEQPAGPASDADVLVGGTDPEPVDQRSSDTVTESDFEPSQDQATAPAEPSDLADELLGTSALEPSSA